jgi:hypothetical protein
MVDTSLNTVADKIVSTYFNRSAQRMEQQMTTYRTMLRYAGNRQVEGIKERIESRRGTFESNCIGTSLYITGESNSDICVGTENVYADYIHGRLLEFKQPPMNWCLVAWQIAKGPPYVPNVTNDVIIVHMGVVTSMDPLLVTNRVGYCDEFIENKSFEELNQQYSLFNVAYYLPRILEGTWNFLRH